MGLFRLQSALLSVFGKNLQSSDQATTTNGVLFVVVALGFISLLTSLIRKWVVNWTAVGPPPCFLGRLGGPAVA